MRPKGRRRVRQVGLVPVEICVFVTRRLNFQRRGGRKMRLLLRHRKRVQSHGWTREKDNDDLEIKVMVRVKDDDRCHTVCKQVPAGLKC